MASIFRLQQRIDELEKLLAAKGSKSLAKFIIPQPIKGDVHFQTYDAENIFFKQLLKIHDAAQKIDFDYVRAFGTDKTPDQTELYEPLGELIIFATTYLDRIGCNADARQSLFRILNRRFEE